MSIFCHCQALWGYGPSPLCIRLNHPARFFVVVVKTLSKKVKPFSIFIQIWTKTGFEPGSFQLKGFPIEEKTDLNKMLVPRSFS